MAPESFDNMVTTFILDVSCLVIVAITRTISTNVINPISWDSEIGLRGPRNRISLVHYL